MKARALQLAIVILEVAGVLVAIAAAAAGYLFWRLEQGPLDLSFFHASIESAVDNQLPEDHRSAVDRIVLRKDKTDGAYDLVLEGLAIRARENGGERIIFSLKNARLNVTARQLSRGRLRPRRIVLTKPVIDLIRGADRRFRVNYGAINGGAAEGGVTRAGERRQTNITTLLNESNYFRDVFERAELVDAEIRFFDQMSGRRWQSKAATATVLRENDTLAIDVLTQIQSGDDIAKIAIDARLSQKTNRLSAKIAAEKAPLGDILEIFYGARAGSFTGPVTGDVSLELDDTGRLEALTLRAGATGGVINFGDRSAPVNGVNVAAAFDPKKQRFFVERLDIDTDAISGIVTGAVDVAFNDDNGALALVAFDVKGEDFLFVDDANFEAPVNFSGIAAAGRYDLTSRRLEVSMLQASFLGVRAHGAVSVDFPQKNDEARDGAQSAEISADVAVDGALTVDRVLRGWPLGAGTGARNFVKNRITEAQVRDIQFTYYSSEKETAEGPLTLKFSIDGAKVLYAPSMTPLTNASGDAVLRTSTFFIDVPRANVGATALTDGEVEFTSFASGAPTFFRFSTNGRAEDLLRELNRPPLEILAPANLTAEAFSGAAEGRIEIMRPNRNSVPLREYQFNGAIQFEELSIADFVGGLTIANTNGQVALNDAGMRVTADARIGEDDIAIDWNQKFYGRGARTNIKVSGKVSSSAADALGVPTRQFLRGQIGFVASASGNLASLDTISVSADLNEALILIEPLGWAKRTGVAAMAQVVAKRRGDALSVEQLSIDGEGIAIDGEFLFSTEGRLESASLSKFMLDGAADLAVSVVRSEQGVIELSSQGAFFNAGPLLAAATSAGAGSPGADPQSADGDAAGGGGYNPAAIDWGPGFRFKNRLDILELREGVQFRDASVEFWRDPDRIRTFKVSARNENDDAVSIDIKEPGARAAASEADRSVDDRRRIEARSSDVGALLRGVFGVKTVLGGAGVVKVFLQEPDDRKKVLNPATPIIPLEGAPVGGDAVSINDPAIVDIAPGANDTVDGVVEANGMRIVGAPLLARVFAAGSWTGLADLLNGDGIELAQAFARFSLTPTSVVLHELRATGPSVGLSATGRIAGDADGGVQLKGAVAPAYQVNSFLGRTPLIGGLFVSREGEGLLALAYSVSGTISAPVVAVNPLSAVTPGVFRRIFEPQISSQAPAAQTSETPGETEARPRP